MNIKSHNHHILLWMNEYKNNHHHHQHPHQWSAAMAIIPAEHQCQYSMTGGLIRELLKYRLAASTKKRLKALSGAPKQY